VNETYTYHPEILEQLARHGIQPRASTSPVQLRDAVRDLYRYEIKRLRDKLLAKHFPKSEYAGQVMELRKRYWVLSVPTVLWTCQAAAVDRERKEP
jgi:hypothetical protein